MRLYKKENIRNKTRYTVLGIKITRVVLDDEDFDLYQKWNDAKAIKDFATADIYRQKLIEKGVL